MGSSHRMSCRVRTSQMPVQPASSFSRTIYRGDLEPDWEYPMDAFDRELLAEGLCTNRQEADDAPQPLASRSRHLNEKASSRYRSNLRNHDIDPQTNVLNHQRTEGVTGESRQYMPSSPLQTFVSSPTVLALQNKRHNSSYFRKSKPKFGLSNAQTTGQPGEPKTPNRQTIERNVCSYDSPDSPPSVQGIPLVPTFELPDRISSVFGFELFNAVQSKCFATAFQTNDNLVLSAPTGSGKTVIMELALCRLILEEKSRDFKIIYQAPTKSLCNERCRDWTSKFKTLGIQCAELTGDAEGAHLRSVQSAHVIITTPEKWDSVTRKWKDNAKLMQMIKLFLVDEVHILREVRGATLEANVSRMKSVGTPVRFVALSASIPNPEDVATWLGLDSTRPHLPARCEVFNESFRPVELEKHVIGYSYSSNLFALDAMLTKEIPRIITQFSKGKPVLVFCATKKATLKTATVIAKSRQPASATSDRSIRRQNKLTLADSDLSEVVSAGVAFHHSGLSNSDRQTVENGFLRGDINVICCTSTLAVGVNLPCYLVIVKGTSCWTDNGLQEYSSLDLMQMLGRAGRPQYEQSACAVILTQSEKVSHYQKMVSGQEILESSLHQNLIEHLNAEIGIGTIHDIGSAKKWLASSFLSVRFDRNPSFYQLQNCGTSDDKDEMLSRICERDLRLLMDAQLIEQEDGFRCTQHGAAMARYYIDYETMLTFLKLPSNPTLSDIVRLVKQAHPKLTYTNQSQLNAVSQAHEFSSLKLRSFEKSMYKDINMSNEIRYPIRVDPALPHHKASILIQARLGGVVVDKAYTKHVSQFRQDTLIVMGHCNRLIRCVIDMQVCRGDSNAVKNALELCRSLAAGVWDDTPMQLKQVESIGEVTARKLVSAGIDSIEMLLDTDSSRIEVIMGKSQPFGNALLKKAARLPNLRISVKELDRKKTRKGAEIRLRCEIGHLNDTLPSYFNHKAVFICFICGTSSGKLVDFRRFSAMRMAKREEICMTAMLEEHSNLICCHVMCDEIVGTHRYAELKLDLDQSWFPSKSMYREDTGNNETASDRFVDLQEFDDSGLADEDLLAAESETPTVEVVKGDIDQILANESYNPRPGNELKRKASSPSMKNLRHQPAQNNFREPKKLRNGKWTCQHTCNEAGKECKHQCCKEGVKKPRNRTRASASKIKTNNKIENTFTTSAMGVKKVHNKSVVDIDEICKERSRSDKSSLEAGYQQASRVLSNDSNEDRQWRLQRAKTGLEAKSNGQLRHKESLPSRTTIRTATSDFANVGVVTTLHSKEDEYRSEYDYTIEDLNAADCDWTVGSASKTIGMAASRDLDQSHGGDCMPNHESSLYQNITRPFTQQAQDGAKTHAMFVSPSKTCQSSDQETNSSENLMWPSDDLEFLNDLDSMEDVGMIKSVCAPSQAPTPIPDAWPSKSPPRLTSHPGQFPHDVVDPNKITRKTSTGSGLETVAEHERRLHDEIQQKRWAELPPWMYEEFGAYVNLV